MCGVDTGRETRDRIGHLIGMCHSKPLVYGSETGGYDAILSVYLPEYLNLKFNFTLSVRL